MGTLRKVRPNGHIFGGIALRATAPATEDKFRDKDKTKKGYQPQLIDNLNTFIPLISPPYEEQSPYAKYCKSSGVDRACHPLPRH